MQHGDSSKTVFVWLLMFVWATSNALRGKLRRGGKDLQNIGCNKMMTRWKKYDK
jgi:hypothetical protein